MLSGSLWDKLLLFALPLALSSILQQVFNSADVAVAGRFAGSKSMAAVGNNAPIINLIINVFLGMSLGANVVIGNLIGQKKRDEIKKAVRAVISVSILSGIFLAFIGPIFSRPILEAIDTPQEVLVLATVYLRIYFLGMPAVMVYNFGSSILRSKGDSNRPLYCLVVSGILNVALNLLFVIVFKMGVKGVAIATVISNFVSAVMILIFLSREEEPFRFSPAEFFSGESKFFLSDMIRSIDKKLMKKIVKIGVPAGLQGMVFSFSNICIQGGINSFGSDAMAGSAAALNFEYFSYFFVSAFTQTATTFTSQNFGARNFSRCKKIFRLSMISSIFFAGLLCFVFVFFRRWFVLLYTADPAVIDFALKRIVRVESFEFLTSTYEISAASLRAMGYSMLPSVLTLTGSCLFRLLWLATVFKKFPRFETIMTVYPVSWVITGTMVIFAYLVIRKKEFGEKKASD